MTKPISCAEKHRRKLARDELRRLTPRNPDNTNRNIWPIEDDQFIIANRRTMSNQALGDALGKSASSVKNRCWRLKIPTSPIGTVYSHPKRPGSAVDKFKLTMLAQAAKTAAATAAMSLDGWPPRARDPERAMERALAGRRYDQAATW